LSVLRDAEYALINWIGAQIATGTEASSIVEVMTDEEKINFRDILRRLQQWHSWKDYQSFVMQNIQTNS